MKHINDVVSHQALITHLTGASNYTWLHFRNGSTLLLSKPLSSFEALLTEFVRVHKTALVNPKYVHQIKSPLRTKTPGAIIMQGGAQLPVSRRRWNQVADTLAMRGLENSEFTRLNSPGLVNKMPMRGQAEQETKQAKHLINPPSRQVCAIIRDDVKSLLLRQILEEKWPNCNVRFFASGATLTDHIGHMAFSELPALVLLDVRAVGWSGLSTLEYIKTDKQLRVIPTVVFINGQSGNDIEICYAAGANSVIPQIADNNEFAKIVERVCQYWLSFAELPVATVS
ncbi:response regulator transcription factor [Spirosoma soli]|uniref:Response regulator transcription factor n=1 Tax=Spirosoma soli TaxID=1770529 RepID=A0ABW5LY42_9BACT